MENNIFLVIGLGNPGEKYRLNRHNVGFLFLDYFREKYQFNDFKKRKNYHYSLLSLNDMQIVLIKPTTFMNLSGAAVVSALSFFKASVCKVCVIYDDIALPFGKIRIRERGSSGGHNGLRSIEQSLGTGESKRIRIGIESASRSQGLRNYVLENFSAENLNFLNGEIFDSAEKALNLIFSNNIKEAMNKYNGKDSKESQTDP
jgi:peptidyl-tRNA hydrolase, PTH1 family